MDKETAQLIDGCRQLMQDLLECGEWYDFALEIYTNEKNRSGDYWSGRTLEPRIREILLLAEIKLK